MRTQYRTRNEHKRPVYDEALGQTLRDYREGQNLTQIGLGKIAGLSQYDFWQLEQGAHGNACWNGKWRRIATTVPALRPVIEAKLGIIVRTTAAPEEKVSETAFDEIYAHGYQAARDRQASLVRKADLCVATARQLLRNGSEESVDTVAVELMRLSDHDLVETYRRLSMTDEG